MPLDIEKAAHSVDSSEMAGTPEQEIEITPEMIEAGEEAIWEELQVPDLGPDFSARDLAIAVWRAMDQRRKSRGISNSDNM
jgi:hypothetical protein